ETEHGIDLTYQDVKGELSGLPGAYAEPRGGLWLARDGAWRPAGCVAIRPLPDGSCELKRMYVRPAFRGRGLGRAHALRALAEARARGYTLKRLDTAAFLVAANSLYADLGFRETAQYYEVPPEMLRITIFMELPLDAPAAP
ncbi:MAG: GNAT family N-acetyltransferase, partial [Thermoleophilia bacterium]